MSKQKILVIDDETHILHVVSLKLRNAGYEVITAQNGREGYEQAQVERPDLIITDFQMPHLTGLELCRKLRQNPGTRGIPAVVLTARGFDLEAEEMKKAGILMCLNKPFSPRQILGLVEQILAAETASLPNGSA